MNKHLELEEVVSLSGLETVVIAQADLIREYVIMVGRQRDLIERQQEEIENLYEKVSRLETRIRQLTE